METMLQAVNSEMCVKVASEISERRMICNYGARAFRGQKAMYPEIEERESNISGYEAIRLCCVYRN